MGQVVGLMRDGARELTDVDGQYSMANERDADLNLGLSDEFGVHSSSVLEEHTAQKSL